MGIQVLKAFLGWCLVINFGVLLVWLLFLTLGRDFVRSRHRRWFDIPKPAFEQMQYAGMALYKMATLMFNAVPYIALHLIVRRHNSLHHVQPRKRRSHPRADASMPVGSLPSGVGRSSPT